MTVQCITHPNSQHANVYDVTHEAPRLDLYTGDKHPRIIMWDGTTFDVELVEASPKGTVVKCPDKWAPGGFVHFAFTGEHNTHVDLTNDAPRRRTEPAITLNMSTVRVTPTPLRDFRPITWQSIDHGHYVEWRSSVGTVAYQMGGAWLSLPPECPAWTPTEVEACKDHGVYMFTLAMHDCDQVRELLAVEEAKAEMEAWRLSNGEWLEFQTSSDASGLMDADLTADMDEQRDLEAAWLGALTPPREYENLADWAGQMPERPWGPGSKAYMQHLYDKLAKGEVVGDQG